MKKKIILLSIVIFPSLIYFFFELTQANFKKMPYFGPKTVNEKGDTVYWSVPNMAFNKDVIRHSGTFIDSLTNEKCAVKVFGGETFKIDTVKYPIYVILFLNEKLRGEGYKLEGLYDYMKFKPKEFENLPMFVISASGFDDRKDSVLTGQAILDSLKISLPNFHALYEMSIGGLGLPSNYYFKGKPEYVFDYFMVLVDKKRHIRGYYDPSFNAEVKRMIDEYKHLKIRDEYAQTLKQNDIKQNEKK